MATILSVAATTLVVAFILRRSAARRKRMGYGPTLEEQDGDDNYCLGIRSLDRIENSSEGSDRFYSPRLPYPTAASI
jgi:hypothetical protein